MNFTRQSQINRRRGSIAVLMAVCLPIVLILAAFAVDVAYMQLVRTELRVATDASALAGGRQLSISQSSAASIAAAQTAASKNRVAGSTFSLDPADIELGSSTRSNTSSRWQFTGGLGSGNTNSLQVIGRKTGDSAAGTASLFFGNIWGQDNFEPVKSAISIQVDRDIALILDRSGSMAWKDDGAELDWVPGSRLHPQARWVLLQTAVESFLDALESTLPTEKVSLATFSSDATLDLSLGNSYTPIRNRMEEITNNYDGASTAIGTGIETGMPSLLDSMTARPFAKKTIVLLTDGEHNEGTSPDVAATNIVAKHDVTIHTITFGATADQALMQTVASIGGGMHWHADDKSDLMDVFNAIANNVPTLLTD